jgi:broad specificity phosphatase PhoE
MATHNNASETTANTRKIRDTRSFASTANRKSSDCRDFVESLESRVETRKGAIGLATPAYRQNLAGHPWSMAYYMSQKAKLAGETGESRRHALAERKLSQMSLQPGPDACLAYLIRHGATASNLADPPVLQGRTVDGPLSTDGQRQAAQVAECLAPQLLTAIYSSPLRRAQETADRIARLHDLPVRTLDEITEADVGAWERRSWVEIRVTEPERYAQFQQDPARYGYHQGENLNQVAERVIPAIEATLRVHPGETIAIVGHNVVNRVVLAHALGLPLALARGIVQNNGGINLLRWRDRRMDAVSINAIFHLFA